MGTVKCPSCNHEWELVAASVDYPKEFEAFWIAYPRKKGKGAAWKSWRALRPDASLVSLIMAAVDAQKKGKDWLKDGGEFIPHPSTWLNQQRWLDEDSTVNDPFARFA